MAAYCTGVFPADEGADDADLDEEDDGWLDLDPENPEKREKVLGASIQKTKDQGLSATGCRDLEKLQYEFEDAVKLKFDADQLANIEPLSFQLNLDTISVRAK